MVSMRILRTIFDIDLSTVAARAGVSRQAISAAENGAVLPRRPMLKQWDRAMQELIAEKIAGAAKGPVT